MSSDTKTPTIPLSKIVFGLTSMKEVMDLATDTKTGYRLAKMNAFMEEEAAFFYSLRDKLVAKYGEQMKDGPSYARLNSGVMIHSQAPETILKDQDWPISVEAQFLGNDGTLARPTMNVCTPGTEIHMNGAMVKAHCTNSKSKIFRGDGWVSVEVEVLGSEKVRHKVDGVTVLEYERPEIGGGVANRFDPAVKVDGKVLTEGYIGLQSESHPVEFRNIRLLELKGCMDSKAKNFKSYFVARDDASCQY